MLSPHIPGFESSSCQNPTSKEYSSISRNLLYCSSCLLGLLCSAWLPTSSEVCNSKDVGYWMEEVVSSHDFFTNRESACDHWVSFDSAMLSLRSKTLVLFSALLNYIQSTVPRFEIPYGPEGKSISAQCQSKLQSRPQLPSPSPCTSPTS